MLLPLERFTDEEIRNEYLLRKTRMGRERVRDYIDKVVTFNEDVNYKVNVSEISQIPRIGSTLISFSIRKREES